MKKSTLPVFIYVLETLAEQGFIDVGPKEGEYDCFSIYNFLVNSGLAHRAGTSGAYWLNLVNEDGCLMLAALLKRMIYEKES